MTIRSATAQWQGTILDGAGTIRTGKGGLEGAYSFKSRFEEGEGTNPEELIGAALAGCFSMALAKGLGDAGFPATSVDTTAKVHLDRVDGAPTVTRIDLENTVVAAGIDEAEFLKIADVTKQNCPISRLLAPGAEITLTASLG
ncbi:peroxiredoxin [Embleya scabrispora]|uniref:Peroxiredoxin n=1 Tax=Embleya scabrispora TaxID=159449 RepID=A0A1T3NPZ4_9ACTN|nr:OsmC family protein [Embleya scabrispora]OPC78780.1 peroxiredoxin [Embleya scabrispora]